MRHRTGPSSLHTTHLKYWFGISEAAREAALRDQDQYVVDRITAYRGNPALRKTMQFSTSFGDGSQSWNHFSPDISYTVAFGTFCL